MLILMVAGYKQVAQKTVKKDLVFKGIENTREGWQLKFADKNNSNWYFNAERSNTEPYVLYSRGEDGSLKVNEKIKNNWFIINYFILKAGKMEEKIIIKVEEKK